MGSIIPYNHQPTGVLNTAHMGVSEKWVDTAPNSLFTRAHDDHWTRWTGVSPFFRAIYQQTKVIGFETTHCPFINPFTWNTKLIAIFIGKMITHQFCRGFCQHFQTHPLGAGFSHLTIRWVSNDVFNTISSIWLVVFSILKNMSQCSGLSHILWKIQNVWNHQPALIVFPHIFEYIMISYTIALYYAYTKIQYIAQQYRSVSLCGYIQLYIHLLYIYNIWIIIYIYMILYILCLFIYIYYMFVYIYSIYIYHVYYISVYDVSYVYYIYIYPQCLWKMMSQGHLELLRLHSACFRRCLCDLKGESAKFSGKATFFHGNLWKSMGISKFWGNNI